MKLSNEELVSYAEDALNGIESAISELQGIEEYEGILNGLKDLKCDLEAEMEPYQEAYDRECEEELDWANREYERSVI